MAFNSPIALTNKNILFCFVGIIVIFVVTDYFLLNQLVSEKIIKNESFDFLSSNMTDKCQFIDPLMQSALERVKSESCRQSLKDVYCQVLDANVELENSCSDFDKTKLNKFVGCFDDSPSGFLLTGYHYNFPKTNAPDLCVQTCFRSAYELAGLKSGKHCFCGDSTDLKKGLEVDESICRSLSCPGNANLTCGGIKSTAVISTGLAKIERPMPEFIPLPDDIETRKRVKILFVLQLNGRNSRQVTRMIRTIYSRDHFYLVHVDQRQNFMFSEMKELQKLFEKKKLFNFKVTENRFATIWGGSTLLTMFLQTIKDSLTSLGWNDWDYVLNMSESDMPLLSLEELEHNLALNNGKSFLSSHGYNTAKFISKQGFLKVFHQCDDRMWSIMTRQNFPRNMRIDGGSDWVIVHRKLAEKAISNETTTQQLLDFFSTILLPLEGFFHTLALNSDYCGNVIYKNLRLTNWNRNQGCRCAVLKPVVDWCGCSPLVFRQIDSRINLEAAQSKKTFFARKFDSFVAVEPIEQAEKNSLRFKPKLLEKLKNEVWNSTWINTFDNKIDFEHKLKYFYKGIAMIFYKNWLDGQEFEPCGFQHLVQVWSYKKNPQTKALPVLTVADGCGNHFELLLHRKNLSRITPDPLIQEFEIVDAEFGTSLDLKEEVFRDVLPVLNVNSKATILFHWKRNFTFPESNVTSPMVNIQWWNPNGRLVKNELVKPYNSIFGGQFAELDFQTISLQNDVIPGLWSVRLPSKESDEPVFYTEFPVFPADSNSILFEKLVKLFFGLSDACSVERIVPKIKLCRESIWSPHFPDPKSQFLPF